MLHCVANPIRHPDRSPPADGRDDEHRGSRARRRSRSKALLTPIGHPAGGVGGVVERLGRRRQRERPERVDHHRQLLGVGLADRLLGHARRRPVGDAPRVEAQRARLDAPAAEEVAAHVVEDLVAVEVGVVVRRGDHVGPVVEPAGHERAHHRAVELEGLVHGRRLVLAAADGLEVVDGEGVGIEVAVPARRRRGGRGRGCRPRSGRRPAPTRRSASRSSWATSSVGPAEVPLPVRRVLEQLALARSGSGGGGAPRPGVSMTRWRLPAPAATQRWVVPLGTTT